MFEKIIKFNLLLAISLFLMSSSTFAISPMDSLIRTENLKAFHWEVISGVEKIVPNKEMSKNSIKKLDEANLLYSKGVELMRIKDYIGAIEQFMLARKSYKRAKITPHDYNYININQLYVINSGKEKILLCYRYLSLVTNKIEKEKKCPTIYRCLYLIGNQTSSISNLSQAIRLDINYFQAYITLEAIYRNNDNKNNADKVRDRMETAEAKLIKKEQKKSKQGPKSEKSQEIFTIEGVQPDVTLLKIVKNDDNLQFNKVSQIKERSMTLVQEGIGSYNNGVKELSNGNYERAIEELKIAEKKLKRGKIKNHGLNFSRAQLTIAYLCNGEKNKLGQVKRNLRNISNKLYETRDWTYNMAGKLHLWGKNS